MGPLLFMESRKHDFSSADCSLRGPDRYDDSFLYLGGRVEEMKPLNNCTCAVNIKGINCPVHGRLIATLKLPALPTIPAIFKTQEQTITEAAFDAAFAKVHQTNNARFDKRDRAQWDALRTFVCKL